MTPLVRVYLSPANEAIDDIHLLTRGQGEYLTEFMGLHISDMEDAGWKVIEDPEELEELERNHPPGNDHVAPAHQRYINHTQKILMLE